MVVPAVLSAGQIWKKDSSKWSEADAQRILTASPWAQSVPVKFHDPQEDIVPQVPLPGPAQAGMGTRGNMSDGKWDGGVAKNPRNVPGVPDLSVIVRWDSALPVREALLKTANPPRLSQESVRFEKDYVISVIGLIPAGSYEAAGKIATKSAMSESGDDANAPDPRNPEQMLEGLMAESMLATPSRLAIRPENIKLDPDTGALYFFFSRKQAIVLADKEAIFETNFASMKIERRFRLKDMMYRGKLEL
jgi:hypothetical protein